MFLYPVSLFCFLLLGTANAYPYWSTTPSSWERDSYPDDARTRVYTTFADERVSTPTATSIPIVEMDDEFPVEPNLSDNEKQRFRKRTSVNSLELAGYLSEYGLDDRDYNLKFFKATLRYLKKNTYFDAQTWFYDTLFRMRLFNFDYRNSTFKELAREALMISYGIEIEDLTKFMIANIIKKQVLYYLTAKKHLARMEDEGYSKRREMKELTYIIDVLEEAIVRDDVPYMEVQNAIGKLQSYGGAYQKIHEEDEWIRKQIDEVLG